MLCREEVIMTEKINWDEATQNKGFISLVVDEPKVLKLTNWRFEKKPRDSNIAAGEIEFIADAIEEDGELVSDKLFTTISKRLKQKLRPIFEDKKTSDEVTINILRIGEQFNTQYSVKEVIQK